MRHRPARVQRHARSRRNPAGRIRHAHRVRILVGDRGHRRVVQRRRAVRLHRAQIDARRTVRRRVQRNVRSRVLLRLHHQRIGRDRTALRDVVPRRNRHARSRRNPAGRVGYDHPIAVLVRNARHHRVRQRRAVGLERLKINAVKGVHRQAEIDRAARILLRLGNQVYASERSVLRYIAPSRYVQIPCQRRAVDRDPGVVVDNRQITQPAGQRQRPRRAVDVAQRHVTHRSPAIGNRHVQQIVRRTAQQYVLGCSGHVHRQQAARGHRPSLRDSPANRQANV